MSNTSSPSIADAFREELELIDKELAANDELFKSISEEIKAVRGDNEDARNARFTKSIGNPNTFVFNMFANANSVKSNKVSLIAHRISIKKTIEDLKIKTAKSEDGDEKVKSVLTELIKKISDGHSTEKVNKDFTNKKEEKIIEDKDEFDRAADKAYEEAMNENPKFEVKEDKKEDEGMIDEERLAISTDGRLFLMDENNEIDSELDMDEKEFYIERDDETGKITYAKTISTNKEIQIIEVEG